MTHLHLQFWAATMRPESHTDSSRSHTRTDFFPSQNTNTLFVLCSLLSCFPLQRYSNPFSTAQKSFVPSPFSFDLFSLQKSISCCSSPSQKNMYVYIHTHTQYESTRVLLYSCNCTWGCHVLHSFSMSGNSLLGL